MPNKAKAIGSKKPSVSGAKIGTVIRIIEIESRLDLKSNHLIDICLKFP